MTKFNVKTFYIYKFMSECKPIYAFNLILFINRGLSITDIAILMALWSMFSIVSEIPFGILADRGNRRNLLVVGDVLHGLCFIIWFFSHSLFMFAIGYALWAIASALDSEEGLMYDNLKSDGCEESFTKVYAKARFYGNAGVVAAIASAGVIVNFVSIEVITLISAAICFGNVLLALRIREKNFYSEQLDKSTVGFFKTFKEAGRFIKGSGVILVSILFLMLFASLGGYLEEFDALIINDFQLSYVWVSILLAVRFAFVALGSILAPKIQKMISSVKRIFLLNVLAFVLLTVFAIIWNQYAILFFGLSFMVMTMTKILLVNIVQNKIKDEGRETVMSFIDTGENIVMILFSLIYGLLADILTLQQVYIIISVYGIVGSLGFYVISRKGFFAKEC